MHTLSRYLIVTLSAICIVGCSHSFGERVHDEPAVLSPAIDTILDKKMHALHELTLHPDIIATVEKSGKQSEHLSAEDIEAIDQQWRSAQNTDPLIQETLLSTASMQLLEFQEGHTGYSEIFITDATGLNVAQTNRTSDYYQADEQWWQDAWNNGVGKSYHGGIEYDDSAQVESIALYVPVQNHSGSLIGVLKAVMDITTLQQSFWNMHTYD